MRTLSNKSIFQILVKVYMTNLATVLTVINYKLITDRKIFKLIHDLLKIRCIFILKTTFKKLYGAFLWMGFNTTEPIRGGSLLFVSKFP